MQQLANEYRGRVRFVMVEADSDGEVLRAFDADSLPSYIVFRDGKPVDHLVINFIPVLLEKRLRGMLDEALAE